MTGSSCQDPAESWGTQNRRVAWCGKPTHLVVEVLCKSSSVGVQANQPRAQEALSVSDARGGISPELSGVGSRSPNRIPVAPAQLVWGALDVQVQVLTLRKAGLGLGLGQDCRSLQI